MLVVLMAAAVTAAFILAGCSLASQESRGSPRARAQSNPAWLLTRSALYQLIADRAVRDTLRDSRVFEVLRPGQHPVPGVTAARLVTFASATALEGAIRSGGVPAGTYGVLYDPEAWAFTPTAEQRRPVQAVIQAAAIAHSHGLRLVVAPALNLTKVLTPGSREPRWRQFLDLSLIGRVARIADVIELQAQSLERSTATYAAFVQAATSQASAANPSVKVLAGLSTNPPGSPVGSRDLTRAIQATRSMVEGYWLNIPGQGARCPTCNPSNPEIAVQTLQALR